MDIWFCLFMGINKKQIIIASSKEKLE